jgi:hypothetical protein
MDRMDLFSTVHKGLRAALFDAAQQVARTDWTDRSAVEATVAAIRRTLAILDDHAQHEDAVILPEIAELGPAVYAELHADHNRVGGLQLDVTKLIDRLLEAPDAERASHGKRLHERMGRLVAEHLLHMEREETTANRLLQAHRTDEELRALHARILRSLETERVVDWVGTLLSAITPAERGLVLAGLEANLPAAAFARVREAARPFAAPRAA